MKNIIVIFLIITGCNAVGQITGTMGPVNVIRGGGNVDYEFTMKIVNSGNGEGSKGLSIAFSTGSNEIEVTDFTISPAPSGSVPTTEYVTGGVIYRNLFSGVYPPGDYTVKATLSAAGPGSSVQDLTTYMLVNDGASGVQYAMNNVGATSLPVTLSSFKVTKEGSEIATLAWSTTEEKHSDYFDVQHSLNAKDWESIGKVKSYNEGKVDRDYTFSFAGKSNGKNYFRLNMVDLDGSSKFSSIRSVTFENLREELLSFGPNPTADYLNINLSDWSTVKSVSILDKTGRSMYSSGSRPEKTISVRDFTSGLYLLKLTRKNGEVVVNKILVSK